MVQLETFIEEASSVNHEWAEVLTEVFLGFPLWVNDIVSPSKPHWPPSKSLFI